MSKVCRSKPGGYTRKLQRFYIPMTGATIVRTRAHTYKRVMADGTLRSLATVFTDDDRRDMVNDGQWVKVWANQQLK